LEQHKKIWKKKKKNTGGTPKDFFLKKITQKDPCTLPVIQK
jgi:hypothetical protein